MSTTMEQSQEQTRPRSKSTFSFHSEKSHDSPSKSKHERKESAGEKRKTHYDPDTKANPNAAMNEAQPIAAALEKPTLQSLRSFQYNDAAGNPIADPDFSNPTRSRWERPLDTIRSFEAAIDGEYKRRAASMRADQTDVMSGYNSRRSSYYGGQPGGHEQNRYSTASYYGNRQARDNYDTGYGMGGPVGGPPRMRYGNRMQSDPGWNRNNGNNVYPVNGYQQSRDTLNTKGSNGSHSDGPYSNEPGSENSSFDRAVPVGPPRPDMGEQYGFNGFGRGPNMGDYNQGPSNGGHFSQQQHQNGANGGPPAPPKHVTLPAPIKLNSSGPPTDNPGQANVLTKNNGDDKRKSWFKRRFSKD